MPELYSRSLSAGDVMAAFFAAVASIRREPVGHERQDGLKATQACLHQVLVLAIWVGIIRAKEQVFAGVWKRGIVAQKRSLAREKMH